MLSDARTGRAEPDSDGRWNSVISPTSASHLLQQKAAGKEQPSNVLPRRPASPDPRILVLEQTDIHSPSLGEPSVPDGHHTPYQAAF